MFRATVIVSTYKRPKCLANLLASLKAQSLGPESFEVKVCDTHSGDETRNVVADFSLTFPGTQYIDVAPNTLSAKRNAGLRAASCDIVILMDDDVVPSASCIEEHILIHERLGSCVVACGQVRYPSGLVRTSNYSRFRDSRHPGPTQRVFMDEQPLSPHMMVAMNCSFRRSIVIEKAGYLSEDFSHYGGEDVEFGYRLKNSNISLIYHERALAYHLDDGGSLRQYMAKLYCASRYGAPTLLRLAPEFGAATKYRWIEAPSVSGSWITKATAKLAQVFTPRFGRHFIQAIAERSDSISFLYCPPVYWYLSIAAATQGAQDRSQPEATTWLGVAPLKEVD